MTRVILVQFAILQIIIAGANTYGNKQIVEMLGEYFSSFKDSPNLIGQRFYENSNEMVFQLEIETDSSRINKALLFGFDTISKFSDISKKKFTHSILIIHFNENILPVVAEANIDCSRKFFIDESYDENKWRKNCLTIKNY